jgi:hypothetical protein
VLLLPLLLSLFYIQSLAIVTYHNHIQNPTLWRLPQANFVEELDLHHHRLCSQYRQGSHNVFGRKVLHYDQPIVRHNRHLGLPVSQYELTIEYHHYLGYMPKLAIEMGLLFLQQ